MMSSNTAEKEPESSTEIKIKDIENIEIDEKLENEPTSESVVVKEDPPEETPKSVDNDIEKESIEEESIPEKITEEVENAEDKSEVVVEEVDLSYGDEKPDDTLSQQSESDTSITAQSSDISQKIIDSPNLNNNTNELKSEKKPDSPEPLSNGDIKIQNEKDSEKNNVLSDDLIFVKPKDKDRGHCYWYGITILPLSTVHMKINIY